MSSAGGVFVSYRSTDAAGAAARLHAELSRVFGPDQVFLDRERISPGATWPAELLDQARTATVMLIVMGKGWLFAQDPDTGDRLLNLPDDWVRREIEEALTHGVKTIPILLDGTSRLVERSLQTVPSLAALAKVQALELRTADWGSDLEKICAAIIASGVTRLPAGAGGEGSSGGGDGGGVAAIDYGTYFTRALQEYDLLDLTTLTQLGADDGSQPRAQLSSLFIPQQARRARMPQSLPRDYLIAQGLDPDPDEAAQLQLSYAWQHTRPEPALGLLTDPVHRCLVLLGDPGMGKSSLARYAVLSLLRARVDGRAGAPPWTAPLSDRTPFLVELRDYIAREKEGRCRSFVDYLGYIGQAQGFGYGEEHVTAALAAGDAIMIFDGLDEIFDPVVRRRCVGEIIGLSNLNPKCRFLITSRVSGFDAHPFEAARFLIATLDDLDQPSIDRFARAWFTLTYPDQSKQVALAHQDLMEALRHRPAMRALAGNPMLLTIMAIVARHERLARSRAGLYAQALKVLAFSWDYRKELQLPAGSIVREMTPEDKIDLLRTVAWEMQRKAGSIRANAVPGKALRSAIEGYFQKSWGLEFRAARRTAREMIEMLQTRNWILTLRGPDLYGFVHRTFLEYLCAAEILSKFQTQEITIGDVISDYFIGHRNDDDWLEILRLLSAQLPLSQVRQVFRDSIIDHEDFQTDRGVVRAFQIFSEQDARRLSQLTEFCPPLIGALWSFASTTRRWYESTDGVLGALNVIGADWPDVSDPLPELDVDGHLEPQLVDAIARSVLRRHPDRRKFLLSLFESPWIMVRLAAVRILTAETNYLDQGVLHAAIAACEVGEERVARISVIEFLVSILGRSEAFDAVFLEVMNGARGLQASQDCIEQLLSTFKEPKALRRRFWDLIDTTWSPPNQARALRALARFDLARADQVDVVANAVRARSVEYYEALIEYGRHQRVTRLSFKHGLDGIEVLVRIRGLHPELLDQLRARGRWLDQPGARALAAAINFQPGFLPAEAATFDDFLAGAGDDLVVRLLDDLRPRDEQGPFLRTRLLRAAVGDGSPPLRVAALGAIGRLPQIPESAAAVLLVLSLVDPVADVRSAALAAWAAHRRRGPERELARIALDETHGGGARRRLTRAGVGAIARRLGRDEPQINRELDDLYALANQDIAEVVGRSPRWVAGRLHALADQLASERKPAGSASRRQLDLAALVGLARPIRA